MIIYLRFTRFKTTSITNKYDVPIFEPEFSIRKDRIILIKGVDVRATEAREGLFFGAIDASVRQARAAPA